MPWLYPQLKSTPEKTADHNPYLVREHNNFKYIQWHIISLDTTESTINTKKKLQENSQFQNINAI